MVADSLSYLCHAATRADVEDALRLARDTERSGLPKPALFGGQPDRYAPRRRNSPAGDGSRIGSSDWAIARASLGNLRTSR